MTIGGKQKDTLDGLPVSEAFNPNHFIKFCDSLTIDTKEDGKKKLKLLGTQRYYVQEIAEGLANDQHFFVVLKGRQLGLSTISLALDLYWAYRHKGTQGSLVTDTDENRTGFRTTLSMYMENLPTAFKVPDKSHNRYELVFANSSRLSYLVAGTKKSSGLGTGKAINFLHATECSSWGDEAGLRNLMATLAEKNPKRFYVFESTARGYNLFQEMWDCAKKSKFQRAIFIGWWRNEKYRKERGTAEFNVFWDNHLRTDEAVWVHEIKELYDFDIEPEQIAWWRCKLEEEIHDEQTMYQEYPPTEEYAFQMTGSKFFMSSTLNTARKNIADISFDSFVYQMGLYVENMKIFQCVPDEGELEIYEWPDQDGYYVIGADPAYGSSEWADRFVASVWRCYSDRMVQVAEYCTTNCNTMQFAWVLAHLCGTYSGAVLNLEINGPGQAVFNELQNLAKMPPSANRNDIYDIASNIRHYLYRRIDSMHANFAFQWQTNFREKERMFSTMRDYFERGMLDVNSIECLEEMKTIVRDNGSIAADGTGKDDRVLGMGLAVVAWNDMLMNDLQVIDHRFEAVKAQKYRSANENVLSRLTMRFLSNAMRDKSYDEDDE
jgi:hypothetical protein